MPLTRRRRVREAGFSYLWVLLLVALMGLGLTVAAEIDATSAQREREKELLGIGRQFQSAVGRYYESRLSGGKREYPSSLDDLLQDTRVPGVRRHLRKIFVDPMTGKPEWGLVMLGGRIAGVHSLSEKKPIKQDRFEPGETSLRNKSRYSEWLFVYPPDLMLKLEARSGDASGQANETEPVYLTPTGQTK